MTVDLDFPTTLTISGLVREGAALGSAHAYATAVPMPYRPDGAVIATVSPKHYEVALLVRHVAVE